MKNTDRLKLEDVLPFLPNDVLIEDIKEELNKSIIEYKSEVNELQRDQEDAIHNANMIREDIKELINKKEILTASDKCDAEQCFQNILTKEFYMFPCQHKFHTMCLIQEVKQHISDEMKKQLDSLYSKRREYEKRVRRKNDDADRKILNETMKELDELIGSECPYCSTLLIRSIHQPFIEDDNTWMLSTEEEEEIYDE